MPSLAQELTHRYFANQILSKTSVIPGHDIRSAYATGTGVPLSWATEQGGG